MEILRWYGSFVPISKEQYNTRQALTFLLDVQARGLLDASGAQEERTGGEERRAQGYFILNQRGEKAQEKGPIQLQ